MEFGLKQPLCHWDCWRGDSVVAERDLDESATKCFVVVEVDPQTHSFVKDDRRRVARLKISHFDGHGNVHGSAPKVPNLAARCGSPLRWRPRRRCPTRR